MKQGSLAERLRVLRASKGLTLEEAGEKIGISRHTLRRLELGGEHAPHYRTLRKIAEGYDVPVEELLEEAVELAAGKAEAPEAGRRAESVVTPPGEPVLIDAIGSGSGESFAAVAVGAEVVRLRGRFAEWEQGNISNRQLVEELGEAHERLQAEIAS